MQVSQQSKCAKEVLPVGGMIVEQHNLIIEHSSTAEINTVMWQGQHVKNFKRFRKVMTRLIVLALMH